MNKTVSYIIKAGLLAGTLDILAAFLYYFLRTGKPQVLNVLKFIASGLFGKKAITGGPEMILAGLVFHYLIALAFTVLFFWLIQQLNAMSINRVVLGIAYGSFVWVVMNLIVVPLSAIGSRPFDPVNAGINLLILILCMGIPLSFMAGHFYALKTTKHALSGA